MDETTMATSMEKNDDKLSLLENQDRYIAIELGDCFEIYGDCQRICRQMTTVIQRSSGLENRWD